MHVGLYWLGVGERRGDEIALSSEVGPFAEGLAEVVERVSVFAHDPVSRPRGTEDVADYSVRASNLELVGLGPKGRAATYPATARRTRAVVSAAVAGVDVLIVRFGRRARTVFDAGACPRTVVLVHGPPGARRSPPDAGPARRLVDIALEMRARRNLQHIVDRAGLFVGDGEQCVRRYGGRAAATALVRLSVRRERFTLAPDDRPDGFRRLLFAGQLTPEKGIAAVLSALALLRDELPGVHLDVVGAGPELETARTRAGQLGVSGAVTFHGWLPPGEALFDRYRSADALLFASGSATESFPRVITEAMAHSVCVVSTRVGSVPEAFTDGRDLLLVDDDPQSIAAAVQRLAGDADLRATLRRNAYVWARRTSVEATSRALVEAITQRWPELGAASRSTG